MWTETRLPLYRRNRLFINVTSMVDVLLILLIFFAISTTFEQSGALEVNLSKTKTMEAPSVNKSHEIIFFSKGSFSLDGIRLNSDQFVQKVRGWSLQEKGEGVLLRADRSVPYGDVIELLDQLRAEGILKIQALTKNE